MMLDKLMRISRQPLVLQSTSLIMLVAALIFVASRTGDPFTLIKLAIALTAFTLVLFSFIHQSYVYQPTQSLIAKLQQYTLNNDRDANEYIQLKNSDLEPLNLAIDQLLTQFQLREEESSYERDRVALALEQADIYAESTKDANQKLKMEVEERKRIETRLTDFQKFLNSIINSMPSALISIDQSNLVTQWNLEAEKLSGIPSEQALGSSVFDTFPLLAKHQDWVKNIWTQQVTQSLSDIIEIQEHNTKRYDLTMYLLQNTVAPTAVIRVDDVTEKYQIQEALIQSEKIMSLGGMAAGMAHEINNPISAIIQNVQNIQRRLDPEFEPNREQASVIGLDLHQLRNYLTQRKIDQFLQNISESGLRASNLIQNMLRFSRGSKTQTQTYPMVEILEKAISIVVTDDQLSTFRENFELNIDQDFKNPEANIQAVFSELEQVMVNLIKNASHAIHERVTSLNDIDEGIISIEQHATDESCIIRVQDNGIGMNKDISSHVFEPFFTTKEIGTGLGLSVSYFIVTEHHGGTMAVESELGSGTVFEISFPLIKES